MQIARRDSDVSVTEGRLHDRQGGATFDGVAGVGVAEPVRREFRVYASVGRRPLQHVVDGALGEMTASRRSKDWVIGAAGR